VPKPATANNCLASWNQLLRALVRPTSARIAVLQICGGHIDLRAKAEFRSARRSGTPLAM
jgi:hypothetical protein